jgi:hypothetical protein
LKSSNQPAYDKFEIPDGVDQRRLRLANDALVRRAVTRTDLGAAPPLPPPLWPETAPAAEAPAGSGPSQSPSMAHRSRYKPATSAAQKRSRARLVCRYTKVFWLRLPRL